MAVFRRKIKSSKTSAIKFTKKFYCKYYLPDGSQGFKCTDKTTLSEAKEWERENIQKLKSLTKEKAVVQEYLNVLRGTKQIEIETAFQKFKEIIHKKNSAQYINRLESMWNDFLAFLSDKYSNVKNINDVNVEIAEEYYRQIFNNGRYLDYTTYTREGIKVTSPIKTKNLSNNTINDFLVFLNQIFNKLLGDNDGISCSPFRKISKLPKQEVHREIFTPEQLSIIGIESERNDKLLYSIFLCSVNTGFREGDACTLLWSDVDFSNHLITRTLNKTRNSTGKIVRIPILDPLWVYLKNISRNGSPYIFPEQANMYLNNPTGLSYRVKKFLSGINLGVETTKKVEGRDRAVSVRDFHSIRHSFCYIAGEAGVPFPIVKDVMGHMTERMTQLYMDHASLADKRKHLTKIPNYLNPNLPVKVQSDFDLIQRIKDIVNDGEDSLLKRRLEKCLITF